MRRKWIALVVLLSMGCYSSVPVETEPRPGQEIVVGLTDVGSKELAQYLGPKVSVVNGRYLGTAADSLQLSVTSTETRTGEEHFWTGEDVSISKQAVATLSEKKISTLRSALLTAGIIGAVLAVRGGIVSSAGNGKRTPPPAGQ